jgi:hypothetical protein
MPTFEEPVKEALSKAKLKPDSDYWRGYIHGLWRGHYGQDIGSADERTQDYRSGHGDGYFAGLMAAIEKEAN